MPALFAKHKAICSPGSPQAIGSGKGGDVVVQAPARDQGEQGDGCAHHQRVVETDIPGGQRGIPGKLPRLPGTSESI